MYASILRKMPGVNASDLDGTRLKTQKGSPRNKAIKTSLKSPKGNKLRLTLNGNVTKDEGARKTGRMFQSIDFNEQRDKIYLQNHLDQNNLTTKNERLATIIRNGKIVNPSDYKTLDTYRTSTGGGTQVRAPDLGNHTMYQFEKDLRKQMLGKKPAGKHPKTPISMNFTNHYISENYDV